MSKVIVFGSLNMDLSIECDRMPREGETIDGDSFITAPGGKGANQAVAAARLGAPVVMIGAVGQDAFGDELIAGLDAAGVDASHVKRLSDATTGTATIIRKGGDNRIILGHGANWALSAKEACELIDELAEPGDILLTQFECAAETTEAVIEHAHNKELYIMVNPAPVRAFPDNLWSLIDYVCLNETESDSITGTLPENPEDAHVVAQLLQIKGIGDAVVTLGSAGAYGLHGSKGHFEPSRKVVAVDTTAAGDTFIGAMAAAHVAGLPFEKAMAYAAGASSIAVSRLGAQPSIPWQSEVEALGEVQLPQ